MIGNLTDKERKRILKSFKEAIPFPNVVIDNFLQEEVAEKLLAEFPRFNEKMAKNEMGQVGPKCVHSNIKKISETYATFYEYINSQEFLTEISKLTGIENLIADPYLFGAGTHENIEGAELDCHIDFNYDGGKNHRRLNLLIYLNKEWDLSWGGAIELHSNPFGWVDNSDEVVTTNCIFNRCVIFETSEMSWHGFKKIHLPEDKKHLSRKLISIYLYTKNRPTEEIAPRHGTFYLPYAPDFSLIDNQEFNIECKRLLIKRDRLLKLAWRTELLLSEQIAVARDYINQLKEAIQPNICGNALVVKGSVVDYYHDQWVGPNFSVIVKLLSPVYRVKLVGWNSQPKRIVVDINGDEFILDCNGGTFDEDFKIDEVSAEIKIQIKGEPNKMQGHDRRSILLILQYIKVY